MLSLKLRPSAGTSGSVTSHLAIPSDAVAIPKRSHFPERKNMFGSSDQGHATAWEAPYLAGGGVRAPSAGSAASAHSHVSKQSSAGASHNGSDAADEMAHMGSWAGRQTQYPLAAGHMQAQVPKVSKAKQAARPRSDADAAWRFRIKMKWRREQLKALAGKEGFFEGESGYEDGGWEDAMQLLDAQAPELGLRLDAWAAMTAGSGGLAVPDSEDSTHLGQADAALALDEEISGMAPARPPLAHVSANVLVMPGAYPGTTIRRVTMHGLGSEQQRVARRLHAPPPPPIALKRSLSGVHAAGEKLRLLAGQQVAILKTTGKKLARSHERDAVWVGCHLAPVELGASEHVAGVAFITVQLRDPASSSTCTLVRGGPRATQAQLMAALTQEVKHMTALYQLPQPRLQLLGSGQLSG